MRKVFYEELEKINFKVTKSFFPLLINGVSKLKNDETEYCSTELRNLEINYYDNF